MFNVHSFQTGRDGQHAGSLLLARISCWTVHPVLKTSCANRIVCVCTCEQRHDDVLDACNIKTHKFIVIATRDARPWAHV
jgi:hypothetical protein